MQEFPPNSRTAPSRDRGTREKRVEQVTSGSAVRKRRPLGRQFKETFIGGDAQTAVEYMFLHVLIPAFKEAIVDAASSGFEKLIYGDARGKRYRGGSAPNSGPQGYVSYNRMTPGRPEGRGPMMDRLPRKSQTRHSFDDIVINSRQEAEEVIDRLYDLVSKFDSATVADLYELTGLRSSHVDHKWGWTNLRGASVGRVRGGGYLLELPDPEYFE